MNKDKKILYVVYFLIVGITAALLVSSCDSKQGIGQGEPITFTPAPLTLEPDSANQVALRLEVNVPKLYFSKRSRLFIIPVLADSDSIVAKYKPLVLDAPIYSKKAERKLALDSIIDPYAAIAQKVSNLRKDFKTAYSDTITLPAGFSQGKLVAMASSDGCGECRAISRSEIADVRRPKPAPKPVFKPVKPQVVEKAEPVVIEGNGEVHLQFDINKYDIDLAKGNNEQELNRMLADIAPILNDSNATLRSLTIYGVASADGSLKFNTTLAHNRANAAKLWLMAHLDNGEKLNQVTRIDSQPEGWLPVLKAMIADGNDDSQAVERILTKYADYNDDVQEKYIRRLPAWNTIKQKYLPKDRKVRYTYTYTIRKEK